MRIGKIAELTGVSRDTIRLYERMGLLKGVTRPFDFNNYKDYEEDNVKRIKFILMMKKVGCSLKECKEVLDKMDAGTFDAETQHHYMKKRLKEIDEKIDELQQLKETLIHHLGKGCSQEDIELVTNTIHEVE